METSFVAGPGDPPRAPIFEQVALMAAGQRMIYF
jgi:hypothetical protein